MNYFRKNFIDRKPLNCLVCHFACDYDPIQRMSMQNLSEIHREVFEITEVSDRSTFSDRSSAMRQVLTYTIRYLLHFFQKNYSYFS